MVWIDDAIPRFLPILNGDIMRLLLPSSDKVLKDFLARCIPALIIVKYTGFDYIHNYLNDHNAYPTILLLSSDLTNQAEHLQQMHPNLRIIQLGGKDAEQLGVTLNLEDHDQIEYLMRRLMEENSLIDLATNKYSEPLKA